MRDAEKRLGGRIWQRHLTEHPRVLFWTMVGFATSAILSFKQVGAGPALPWIGSGLLTAALALYMAALYNSKIRMEKQVEAAGE